MRKEIFIPLVFLHLQLLLPCSFYTLLFDPIRPLASDSNSGHPTKRSK